MTERSARRDRDNRKPTDYRHLPTNPSPEQWHATQDVNPLDEGPQRFAYNDDADIILRYIAGA